jgi:uncharacterized protein with PIN domain
MSNAQSRKHAAVLRQSQIRSKMLLRGDNGITPRFVADVMLGRLAKWLRIAGFDVLYSNRYSDDELITLSRKDDRILLSRDTRLLVRKTVRNFIFLESERIGEQVRQVLVQTRSRALPGILTRCLHCNEKLVNAPREQVRGRVPAYVYETQAHFKRCPECGKLFWAGTHRQSMLRTLIGSGFCDVGTKNEASPIAGD